MIHELRVPRVNANEDEIVLQEIRATVGQAVQCGEELFLLETTKTAFSVEAEAAGFVRRIPVSAPAVLEVGALLCVLTDTADEPLAEPDAARAPQAVAGAGSSQPRSTAKERLQARRAAQAARAGAPTAPVADSAAAIMPSEALPWVKAARQSLAGLGRAPAGKWWETIPNGGSGNQPPGVTLGPGVIWGAGARVRAQRLFLGEGAVLGSHAVIEAESVYLGACARIGAGTRITTDELILGDGVVLGEQVRVDLAGGRSPDSRLLVGEGSLVASGCQLNTCREVLLEVESALSPGVMVFTHSFWQSVLEGYAARFSPVHLAPRSWVGAGCQVLPGVRIGAGAVVMSNSTVCDDVPPFTLVGGVPARVLRREIRRPLSPQAQFESLRGILEAFRAQLEFKGCQTKPLPEGDGWTVELPDGQSRAIRLWARPAAAGAAAVAPGSLLVLLRGRTAPPEHGAVFALEPRQFTGVLDPLAHELRNCLRRRGLRFQPFAWNSSHEGGL